MDDPLLSDSQSSFPSVSDTGFFVKRGIRRNYPEIAGSLLSKMERDHGNLRVASTLQETLYKMNENRQIFEK